MHITTTSCVGAQVRHYVEFHLEQGPQLEASGLALGVVSGIAGQTWLHIAVEGVQNHGGESRSCSNVHFPSMYACQTIHCSSCSTDAVGHGFAALQDDMCLACLHHSSSSASWVGRQHKRVLDCFCRSRHPLCFVYLFVMSGSRNIWHV